MHDCILAIFWPKKKIVEFLSSVGCPSETLPSLPTEQSRHEIVVNVFTRLGQREDRGYSIFQTMIDRLANWAHFDSYYFDDLKELDRKAAQSQISNLRSMIARRNASTQAQRGRAKQDQAKHDQKSDLTALQKAFVKVYGNNLSPQARGKLFESFLKELFNRQSIRMGDPFRLVGEEIDGTFKFEGENYITEAKWQEASVSTSQLYHFAHKVDGKMHGRGLFVSVNGFSAEGIRSIVHGKMIRTMLMDGQDLSHVLESRISLENLLDEKIRAAQTRGEVYYCPIIGRQKV